MVLGILLTGAVMMAKPIVSSTVEYRDGGTVMEGYVAKPKGISRAPIVLIVHDWNGIDAYEEGRARQIAELGYIGFAIDIYGKGVRPQDRQACAAESQKYSSNHALLLSRIRAALTQVEKIEGADRSRVAMMGYCFGGMVALEAARAGVNLKGAISFHGSLATRHPAQKGRTKARVLVLHGGADPLVPRSDVESLKKEMDDADVPLRIVEYPGALHAFTVPGPEPGPGATSGYNPEADKASWRELVRFLREIFA